MGLSTYIYLKSLVGGRVYGTGPTRPHTKVDLELINSLQRYYL